MKITMKIVLLFFCACLFSCNKQTPKETAEPEPLSFTLYSENTELFVEFKPLVVGETSTFAAHFTVLGDNFSALEQGTITVSLIVGGKGIKQTVSKASSPGIFRLSLQPTVAGNGKLVFDIKTKGINDQITIDNIPVHANSAAAAKEQPADGRQGDISFLKEQAWKIEFANERVSKNPFNSVIKTSGQILSSPGDQSIITANAAGVVRFASDVTTVGTKVNSGSALFFITGGEMTQGNINASVSEARANYLKSKADYDRAKLLAEDQIISQREFQQIKLRYDNDRTAYNTLSKNYSSKGMTISSPISGFIKDIAVAEGQFVNAGQPMATVSKNGKLQLQANVSQSDFDKLPAIRSANFKIANDQSVYNTSDLNGKVLSFGRSATQNNPFIPITFEIDNNGKLISGTTVEVFLKSGQIENALSVPVLSLIEEQGIFYVYVQTGGESFEKREVKISSGDGQRVQVLSGLAEGERVVTKGAYQIKLAAASGALPAHGHEH